MDFIKWFLPDPAAVLNLAIQQPASFVWLFLILLFIAWRLSAWISKTQIKNRDAAILAKDGTIKLYEVELSQLRDESTGLKARISELSPTEDPNVDAIRRGSPEVLEAARSVSPEKTIAVQLDPRTNPVDWPGIGTASIADLRNFAAMRRLLENNGISVSFASDPNAITVSGTGVSTAASGSYTVLTGLQIPQSHPKKKS